AWVSVTVEGLPPGSRLLLDGLPASSTFRVPRGGRHVVEITAPGYEVRRIELEADRNRTVHANLRPAEDTLDP
ncbi:MAG TPA: PEGA domain-containing protein, partial [Sandaracinaceae bacterium]